MKHFYLIVLLVSLPVIRLEADDTLRVCTWNILNYSEANESNRLAHYKKVMDLIDPDILLLQGIDDSASIARFKLALDPEKMTMDMADDETETDNMIYHNSSPLKRVDLYRHPMESGQDISEYVLMFKSTELSLHFFCLRLQPGSSEADIALRAAAIDTLYERLREIYFLAFNAHVVVAGDLQLLSPDEPGYKKLLNPFYCRLHDPVGNWTRDTEASAATFTSSTRLTDDEACGGAGAIGGLRDRFDMILFSDAMNTKLLPSSYTVPGNDGQIRFHNSINSPENTAVSTDIANALFCASDHLPVYADFVLIGPQTSVPENSASSAFRIYPMPATGESVIELQTPVDQISIVDILGREVYSVAVGGRTRVPMPELAPGMYSCRAGAVSTLFVVK